MFEKLYPKTDWKKTNSYTKKQSDETIYVIEYSGSSKLSLDEAGTFASDLKRERKFSGQVNLVKRGDSWYSVN